MGDGVNSKHPKIKTSKRPNDGTAKRKGEPRGHEGTETKSDPFAPANRIVKEAAECADAGAPSDIATYNWRGNGALCELIDCTKQLLGGLGRCCLPDGTCVEESEQWCTARDGTFDAGV